MDNKNKKQDFLVKIVCLICSFGLWLYVTNVENPNITSTINGVTVQLLNEDVLQNSKLTLSPGQEFKVNVTVQGNSSEVYSLKSDDFKLAVDLSSYALKKGENHIPVDVQQSPSNVNIKRPENLKITIDIDDLVEKSVPVTADINITAKKGSYPAEPVVSPANAVVSGPSQLVDKVEAVIAAGEAKDVENDVALTLPLKAADKNNRAVEYVKINPNTANVVVPVKKGKTVSVNIKTKGKLNSNLLMKSLEANPDKVEITGDEATIRNIQSIDTEAVDLSLITTSKDIVAKLQLPNGVNLVNNNKGTVNLKFVVEGISQKTLNVKVTLKGLKDGLKATLEKDTLSVTIQGPTNILDEIKELTTEIDISNLGEGTQEVAPNIVLKEGATLVSVNPAKVKITITKQ